MFGVCVGDTLRTLLSVVNQYLESRLAVAETSLHQVLQFCKSSAVQELCESRGGRPGLSVLTSLLVSVDVKIY